MFCPEVRINSLESTSRDIFREDVDMAGEDAGIDEALEILETAGEGEAGAEAEDAAPKPTFVEYAVSYIQLNSHSMSIN